MENLGKNEPNGKIERLLSEIDRDIKHEEGEIRHLESELGHERENLDYLKDELRELKEEVRHQHNDESIKLIFIVNGEPAEIKAQETWPLKKAIEEALQKTGNEGRKTIDWQVKWNNASLDINESIKALCLPECAELFLSLKAGHGGAYFNSDYYANH